MPLPFAPKSLTDNGTMRIWENNPDTKTGTTAKKKIIITLLSMLLMIFALKVGCHIAVI
jgi:hypothetical protein